MKIFNIPACWLVLLFGVVFYTGCLQPVVPIDENMPLKFSRDTVIFDTVFTGRGSATQIFKVYNEASEDVQTDIYLSDNPSMFRINVDGIAGDEFEDITIPAMDSIYIFLEVTIDPDQPLSISPFVIEESLVFETQFGMQEVILTAWGQNANYITPAERKRRISLLSCDFQELRWDDPRPYVIYGVLVIDSCTLVWPSGTEVYVHGGIVNNDLGIYNDGLLFFGSRAKLITEGDANTPVMIQGDRLEPAFEDVPGQWSGLRFGAGAEAEMQHTIIKNAANGLVLDSGSTASLDACQILNSAGIGLAARRANLVAKNCLIAIGGVFPVQLTFGGNYSFTYCTIVNYARISQAFLANNFTCYDPECMNVAFNRLSLTVKNSIIAGSTDDQLALINGMESQVNFRLDFANNLIRTEDFLDNYPDFYEDICNPCWNFDPEEPLFEDPFELNFQLDSLSQAMDKAEYLPEIPRDALDVQRDPSKPDLGCFELIEP